MLNHRPKAPRSLSEGYAYTRDRAAKRKAQVEPWGDETEVKAWEKIRSYCDMMATCQFVDEPETKVDYIPLNDKIFDKRLLEEIMRDAEESINRQWTNYHQMALDAAMALLSPMERVVTEMIYAAQVEREEVARMLGLSVHTIDNYLQRAKKKWARLRN